MTSTKVSLLVILSFLLLAITSSATELRNLQGTCSNLNLPRCLQCVDNKVCTQCTPGVILNNGNCDCKLTEVIGCTDCFKSVFVPPFNGTNATGAGTVISFICTGCPDGTILTDDKKSCDCTKTQVAGCSKCATVNGIPTCLQCFAPNLLSANKKACDCSITGVENCGSCSRVITVAGPLFACLTCKVGTIPFNFKCDCAVLNLPTCLECAQDEKLNNICTTCTTGLLPSANGKNCDCSVTGVANCVKCSLTLTGVPQCTECSTGLILSSTGCGCPLGTVLNTLGVCVDCASFTSGCQTCQQSGGKTTCIQCVKGKLLNNGVCIDCSLQLIKDCIQCTTDGLSSTTCSQCQIGLIIQNNGRQCNGCSASSIPNCRTCASNGVISTCSQCKQGFYKSGGCLQCSSSCRTCKTRTFCLSCNSNDRLDPVQGTCTKIAKI